MDNKMFISSLEASDKVLKNPSWGKAKEFAKGCDWPILKKDSDVAYKATIKIGINVYLINASNEKFIVQENDGKIVIFDAKDCDVTDSAKETILDCISSNKLEEKRGQIMDNKQLLRETMLLKRKIAMLEKKLRESANQVEIPAPLKYILADTYDFGPYEADSYFYKFSDLEKCKAEMKRIFDIGVNEMLDHGYEIYNSVATKDDIDFEITDMSNSATIDADGVYAFIECKIYTIDEFKREFKLSSDEDVESMLVDDSFVDESCNKRIHESADTVRVPAPFDKYYRIDDSPLDAEDYPRGAYINVIDATILGYCLLKDEYLHNTPTQIGLEGSDFEWCLIVDDPKHPLYYVDELYINGYPSDFVETEGLAPLDIEQVEEALNPDNWE